VPSYYSFLSVEIHGGVYDKMMEKDPGTGEGPRSPTIPVAKPKGGEYAKIFVSLTYGECIFL
jgi:hypothetical protein